MTIVHDQYSVDWIKRLPLWDNPFFVTIPCYSEPDVKTTLLSLDKAAGYSDNDIVTILLINSSVGDDRDVLLKNKNALETAISIEPRNYYLVPLWVRDIPDRLSGVGYARRLAMDAACFYCKKYGFPENPVLCLDADSTVAENYFIETTRFFNHHPELDAASIYFEHPVQEVEDSRLKSGIIDYENHLRYFILAQKWSGHPHAFHTVGSSMAVRAAAYSREGGMNKRKAGEDFYFLHKFSKNGTLGICNETAVLPASRISDRVPFGTGRAMLDIKAGKSWTTYAPETFFDLKRINDGLRSGYQKSENEVWAELPVSFQKFIDLGTFEGKFKQVCKHSASSESYTKRLFQWWDAFMVFKYAHFCRDHFYPNLPVDKAVYEFFDTIGQQTPNDPEEQLEMLRRLDRSRGSKGE
ncbi:MAG: hypothetical protein EA411_03440 [Saprospirales bacterium]|nr:MAG: hypothetical protein EA411_03440 [Saprospirales bacterium]